MEFHKEAVAVQICSLPTVVQLKMSYHMKMVYGYMDLWMIIALTNHLNQTDLEQNLKPS